MPRKFMFVEWCVIAVCVAFMVGWCVNVYRFCTSDFESPYRAEIIRGVGIPVAPVGAVVGFIDLEED